VEDDPRVFEVMKSTGFVQKLEKWAETEDAKSITLVGHKKRFVDVEKEVVEHKVRTARVILLAIIIRNGTVSH
jgi:hypothetical protein